LAALLACSPVAFAACSGSGGSAVPGPSALPQAAAQAPVAADAAASATARVSFSLRVPSTATTGGERPDFVSRGAKSATIGVTPDGGQAGAPVVLECSAGKTCTTSFAAPAGSDTFTVAVYAQAGGQGTLLGTGSATQTVVAGAKNIVAVTLNGVVNSVRLQLNSPDALEAGKVTTEKVTIQALDPLGYLIVAPGGFVDAAGNSLTITVANTDDGNGSGKTTLAAPTPTPGPAASSSATRLTYDYNGGDIDETRFTSTTSSAIAGAQGAATIAYAPRFIKRYPDASGSDTNFVTAGADGNLWFTDFGTGDVGSLAPSSGAITHYRIPSSVTNGGAEPEAIVAGPNGTMYFAEYNSNAIGSISTTLAASLGASAPVTETLLTTANANPRGIAYDGACSPNVWFTEFNGDKIGALSTTTMTVTEYATGLTAAAEPDQIACGPDGNFWFTEFGANKIGRITSAGTITEYPLPSPGEAHAPIGIVAGADGSMWFAESAGNMISSIATAKTVPAKAVGTIAEYPLPKPAGNSSGNTLAPSIITSAPDGDLFFSEFNSETGTTNAMLGRLTTSASTVPGTVAGKYSHYPLANSSDMPYGITLGPDGHIWYTEMGSDYLGYLIY
jgi:streptogramin lyase